MPFASKEDKKLYQREYMRNRYRTNAVHREKVKARAAAMSAFLSGRIVKSPCESCGGEATEMHHDDYAKPLDVVWLCHDCHEVRHGGPGFRGTVTQEVK